MVAAQATVIGTWTAGNETSSLSLRFTEDNVVTFNFVEAGESSTYTGYWALEGTKLLIVLDGEEITYDVVNLTSSDMVLAGGDLDGELYFSALEDQNQQVATETPSNPLMQPDANFSGVFVGDDISLELTSSPLGYEGTLTFQGQPYLVEAQDQGEQLRGSFLVDGQSFAFNAFLEGDTLTFNSDGSSFQLERQASQVPPANPLTTSPQPPKPAESSTASSQMTDELVGKWLIRIEENFLVEEETLYLLPDGRYISVLMSEATGYDPEYEREEGIYTHNGNQIIFRPLCSSEEKQFDLELMSNQFAISGQDVLGEAYRYVYTREADVDAMMTEVRADEARSAENNQPYLARTPIGSIQVGASPQANIPVDPNPSNVDMNATVFTEGELYTFVSTWSYVFDVYGQLQSVNEADIVFNTVKMQSLDYNRGTYRDTAQWFFLPNGRFYTVTELYGAATSTDPLTPMTESAWGSYTVDGDRLILTEDAGNVIENLFLDGRRAFAPLAGGVCFKEVTWATEQLEQQTEELDN